MRSSNFLELEDIFCKFLNQMFLKFIYSEKTTRFCKISTVDLTVTKGQLILKCLFGVIIWTNIATIILSRFLPLNFCSFLGDSWKLFGLHWDLLSDIINKEAYRKPQKASRKPQGSYKKFRGRNLDNIFVAIFVQTITPQKHFKIH